jgi:hypothetical protein
MNSELISLHVPSDILAHFEYEGLEELRNIIRIHLTEKSDSSHIPKELEGKGRIVQNGFMNPLELQTFPTKGKEIYLFLKRRRWRLEDSSHSYFNTYTFNAKGMKATKEFGAFLKEIGRG